MSDHKQLMKSLAAYAYGIGQDNENNIYHHAFTYIEELEAKIAALEARMPVVCECCGTHPFLPRYPHGLTAGVCSKCNGVGAIWEDGE